MSFRKRLPERSLSIALGLTAAAVSGTAAVSCSDSDRTFDLSDAGPEGSLPEPIEADAPKTDAGRTDASPVRDAARSDAGPAPVVCASSTCATALTTTLDSEGFCALLSDKTVACWGQNTGAELGRGEDAGLSNSPTPARVVDLADVVGLEHTCAIDTSGGTWCWGTGPYLRDTTVPTTREPRPVKLDIPPVTKLGIAASTACASNAEGVLCWGANLNGQVAAPGPTTDLSAALPPQEISIPSEPPIHDLVVGNASFVLHVDGTMLSWGANPPVARVSSLSPDPYPDLVALTGVSDIAAAGDNACAVAEGIAYCWGSPLNTSIYTPLEPLPERRLPEPVLTPEPVVQIASTRSIKANAPKGIPAIPQRACAVSVSGAVYCWGANASGQAGDGTTTYAYSPVKVAELPGPVAQVKTTPVTTCALLTNGEVYCWGDGFSGQLGRNKLGAPSLVPQEVLLP